MAWIRATPAARVLRLRDYRTVPGRAHCPCCKRRLVLANQFQHWRAVRSVWFAVLFVLLPLFVLLAPLAFCCLPLWAALLLSIAPMNELARRRERCRFCGSGLGQLALEGGAEERSAPGAPQAIVLRLRPKKLQLWRSPSARH